MNQLSSPALTTSYNGDSATVVAVPEPPILLEVDAPWEGAYAGEWVPLRVALFRPGERAGSIRLRHISCVDPDVQLDLELLERDVEVRPGDHYRLTLPVKVNRPRLFELRGIKLQIVDPLRPDPADSVLIDLDERALSVQPAVGREVEVAVETLCTYDQGTKLQVRIQHNGALTFDHFTLELGPRERLVAGKAVLYFDSLKPGMKQQFEVVLAPPTNPHDVNALDVRIDARVEGQPARLKQTFPVQPPRPQQERRFRFLEPRRLCVDQRAFAQIYGDLLVPLQIERGAVTLCSDRRYLLTITPQQTGVREVNVQDIPYKVHVRRREEDRERGCWRFYLDVSVSSLFRQNEVLYYDVITDAEPMRGEIPVCLRPTPTKRWQMASTLGLALSLQGVYALLRAAQHYLAGQHDLMTFLQSDLSIKKHPMLLGLLSVPAAWLALGVADWFQHRLQT
jgi:hypothetical protein